MFLLMSWDVLYKKFFGRTPKRLPKEAFLRFSTDFGHIFVNLGFEWSLVRLTTKVLSQERQILTNRISILKKKICRTILIAILGGPNGSLGAFWLVLRPKTAFLNQFSRKVHVFSFLRFVYQQLYLKKL